jgi:sodium-dependent dicarboxylate transporter 2/3/5
MTRRVRLAALIIGPVAGLLLLALLPESYVSTDGSRIALSGAARATAAVGLWMAIWWMTEAISIYATALLPLAAFPLLGATSIREAAVPYGHELIFLFLGGFVLALALERWGVHRRLALRVLSVVGSRPTRMVGAFMFIAAFISMWVTNTATTIMLLPVALSVLALVPEEQAQTARRRNLCLALLLGIAYAASIGGVGTIIGTAPNVFVVSFIERQMNVEISFLTWTRFALPLVLVFLPMAWWLLVRRIFPLPSEPIAGVAELLAKLRDELGTPSRGERLVFAVFLATAAAWVTRPLLNELEIGGSRPLAGLTDPGIAVISALILFVTPVRPSQGEFLMNWETAVRLPWGLLILFGGGLSLAAALDRSGFSAYLGGLAAGLGSLPAPIVVLAVVTMMIFLTEITSNTATTATLVPVLYAVALGLGLDPFVLVIPAAIAASCAFMLPVATPPNAIVFGSGQVTLPAMTRAGLRLNLLGIILIPALVYGLALPILGGL